MPEYEVRCYECNVAYPPGTKRCLYCGGRPGAAPGATATPSMQDILRDARAKARGEGRAEEAHPIFDEAELDDEVVEEPESRKATIARLMGNLVWIVLLIAVTVYRACAG